MPGLLETIARVTDKPIRFLINTHHHGDHVGGNPLIAGRVQGIIAHAKANPGRTDAELAASFKVDAWPEWKPRADFVTWETLFGAVTGRGPGRNLAAR